MTNGLQVISSRLLIANVRANRGVPGRTSKVFALTEGDMLTLRVLVALRQTKVNNIDVVLGALVAADQEVIWLDITVDDALFVHLLDSVDLNTDSK